MISMPERTDKRDSFALAASVTDFDYNITDGVDGGTVSLKALPYTMQQNPRAIGCWRAHLNVWEDMVRRGVSSTLVFEDDVDWDIGIRSQLIEVAKGTRYAFHSSASGVESTSPYGDDWDLLWIGHCGSMPTPWNTRRWVIHDDMTVLESPDLGRPEMSRYESGPDSGQNTRLIFPTIGGVCTGSYAISLKGARKALYRTSLVPYNEPVDWGLHEICSDRDFGFKCMSTYPTIIGTYRAAGNVSRGSDIGYGNEAEMGINEEGHSERLAFSTRANLDRILRGADRFANAQGTDDMSLEEITNIEGYGIELPVDQRYADMTNDQLRNLRWDWNNLHIE